MTAPSRGPSSAEPNSIRSQSATVASALTLPGFLTKKECDFLYTIAPSAPPGIFVEIGAWQGRSSLVLCEAALECRTKLISVDNFSCPPDVKYRASSLKLLTDNLAAFGCHPTILPMDSDLAAPLVTEPIGLLMIDGDHRPQAIWRDINAWFPKLVSDAVVLFHDYGHPSWPAISSIVATLLERRPPICYSFALCDRFIALRYVPQ